MEQRIIIAGSGGQGILFLGKLISRAAMLEQKEVTWFPSYGAEMRGGTANCTVIIADSMIGSPVIRNPDTLLIMNDASYKRFHARLLSGGLLICDASLVTIENHRTDIRIIRIPASGIAATLHATKSANMVMMGAFVAATRCLSIDAVLGAVNETIPSCKKDLLEINKTLIMEGYTFAERQKSNYR